MILVRRLIALACSAAALTTIPAQAELIATPLPGDSRLVEFDYDADNTYLLLTRPKAVTHLEFGKDEVIQTIASGDTKNWEMVKTTNGRNIFIKPTFDDMETSMTVLTSKRSYQFMLRSTSPGSKFYQRVTWRYGSNMIWEMDDVGIAAAAVQGMPVSVSSTEADKSSPVLAPDQLKFNYVIEGSADFRPAVVFDDGRFTWIKMPAGLQELPALFGATEDDGDFLLVNYLVKGDYLQVQRRLDAGVLKLGKSEVRFKRSDKKSQGWLSSWWERR